MTIFDFLSLLPEIFIAIAVSIAIVLIVRSALIDAEKEYKKTDDIFYKMEYLENCVDNIESDLREYVLRLSPKGSSLTRSNNNSVFVYVLFDPSLRIIDVFLDEDLCQDTLEEYTDSDGYCSLNWRAFNLSYLLEESENQNKQSED